MRINKFKCDICKQTKEHKSEISTGYGINDKNEKVCFVCCADADKKYMAEKGRITLYLSNDNGKWQITNWPSSLKFPVICVREGNHNWGLRRIDIWFVFNGFYWHGVQIGHNTQLCHCKRTKEIA